MIRWRYITGESETASRGLATDEFLMDKYSRWAEDGYPDPVLRISTLRSHCVLVGRFQNTEAEVNLPECSIMGVEVNRRATGGGTVLMGEDQLLVSFASSAHHPIVPAHPARMLPKLAKGIVAGLELLGIPAEFRPKNDIEVGGRKIGGTAIYIEESGALLYHATVLLDFDMPLMLETLSIPMEKISDKEINSIEERLTTANRELGRAVSVDEAREAICKGFEQAFKMSAVYSPFSPEEIEKIEKLEREKYKSPEWVFQRQPAPDMLGTSIKKTPAGMVRAYASLSGDIIKSVLITGDFFSGDRIINNIEAALKWGKSDRESIAKGIKLTIGNETETVEGIDVDMMADIIYSAVVSAKTSQSG